MRTENIIESVTLTIMVPTVASYNPGDDEAWGRLDEVLTTPGFAGYRDSEY